MQITRPGRSFLMFVFLATLLSLLSPSLQAQALFPFAMLETGPFSFSVGVAAGDLNGDGNPDLAAANYTGTVAILLGNGDGTFQPRVEYPVGATCWTLALKDVNHDNHLDVITSCYDDDSVFVLLGRGDGTFGAARRFATGHTPQAMAVGDLNGDTHLDIVTANLNANTISVLLGNGDGTFRDKQDFDAGDYPYACVLNDVNGDGRLDIAVANSRESRVSILLGNGDGTFQARRITAVGSDFITGLALGDVTGDGQADIVTSNAVALDTGGTVSILAGNGDGTFQASRQYYVVQFPNGLLLEDRNGDGLLDIVCVGLGNPDVVPKAVSAISVLLNQGNGVFGSRHDTAVWFAPNAPLSVDLNRDGVPDCVLVRSDGSQTHQLSVVLGKVGGSFEEVPLQDNGTYGFGGGLGQKFALSDLNGDGNPDIVSYLGSRSGTLSILVGNGDGMFQPPLASDTAGDVTGISVGDLNGDGVPDVVAALDNSWTASILIGQGDGTFFRLNSMYLIDWLERVRQLRVADVNGDGKLDIIGLHLLPGAVVSVLLGNGDGSFQSPLVTPCNQGISGYMDTGDFNEDGKTDLLLSSNTASEVWLGRGDGRFQPPIRTNQSLHGIAADVNGDGHLDMIGSFYTNTNVLRVALGKGDGTFPTIHEYPIRFGVGFAGDVNGDGKVDLVGNNEEITGILLGNGDGTFQPLQRYGIGPARALGDVNGDGSLDILVNQRGVIGAALNRARAFRSVSGVVEREGLAETATPQAISFDFRSETGALLFTRTVSVPASGAFAITDLPAGRYTAHIKGTKYLAANVSLDLTANNTNNLSVPLRGGDGNNDNSVDALDLALLVDAFNTMLGDDLYQEAADFTGDNAADALDLAVLITNFNLEGEP